MARIRQFKPGFFTDDKVGRLSRDARLFFFGVLSESDDEGRLVDAPKRLAGVIYPFDDDVTPKKVEKWLDELVAQRMVLRYTHEGGKFLYIRKFKDHQKMSHPTPSSLPPPPSNPGQSSRATPETFRKDPGEPPEGFAPEGVLVFEGVLEGLSEGVPSGERSSSSLDRVGDDANEEEDHDPVMDVCRGVALRRHDQRSEPIPAGYRRDAWLTKTAEDIWLKIGADAQARLDQGATVADLLDMYQPLDKPVEPVPIYPDADAGSEPVWDDDDLIESEHGLTVLMPRRTG